VTIQLRYLQTLIEISGNQSSTIVLPLPTDIIRPLMSGVDAGRSQVSDGPERERLDRALADARAALERATGNHPRLGTAVPRPDTAADD
jgi:hypothetical protein